jgi:ketosteroid isomerase-like protein
MYSLDIAASIPDLIHAGPTVALASRDTHRAMSQENVKLLREAIDRWNRHEVSLSAFHADVEWLPMRVATEGVYRGIAGIERFLADTEEVFDKFELHCELLEQGEHVLAWGTIHVRARSSGIETDIAIGGVAEFREGKIVRWEDFGSKDKALQAIGQGGPT